MSVAHPIARFVPTGNLLTPDVSASRHRLLVGGLRAHVPVPHVVGPARGFDPGVPIATGVAQPVG